MISLLRRLSHPQAGLVAAAIALLACIGLAAPVGAQDAKPPALEIADSEAASEDAMSGYAEQIEHTDITIDMVPIPGGEFTMGSPDSEDAHNDDEGPQHKVRVAPFWMSKCEITWDAYEVWMFDLDIQRRQLAKTDANQRDDAAEEYQISQPTEPYTDMTFGMGKRDYPAICMTQFGGKIFCKWLTMKTGRYYRLPTEAEWEYACRAGTTTAYSFGDDPDDLDDYGWYFDNSDESYQKIGQKEPNPWGLHDMHGNVSEWVLDQHTTDFYGKFAGEVADNPLCNPTTLYPRVIRGGSWDDDPEMLRSAVRAGSTEDWSSQDPQIPKSIWYHTDALHVGLRIIRPLTVPSADEIATKWDKSEPEEDRKMGR